MDKAAGEHEPCQAAFRKMVEAEPGAAQAALLQEWVEMVHAFVRERDPEIAQFLREPPSRREPGGPPPPGPPPGSPPPDPPPGEGEPPSAS
jgi:hypothetical protein